MPLLMMVMASLFVGLPTALYFRGREEARRRWLPRVEGTTHVGGDSYRGADVPKLVAGGAPRVVQVTAVMSWVLGTMFVPGILGGFMGLFVAGLGLVSVPGLILAARLFALGGPLLRGEPGAAARARSAASFARVLNAIVLAVTSLVGAAMIPDVFRHGFVGDSAGGLLICAAIAVYAAISLVHARLLDRSAEHIDAEAARQLERAQAEADAVAASDHRTGVRIDAATEPAPEYAWDEAADEAVRRAQR